MLKLINETLVGTINGSNKIFTTVDNKYIAQINNITVDGTITTAYTIDADTITFTTAPITSAIISYFYREELDIEGNGEVTQGDIKQAILDALMVEDFGGVYDEARIERRIYKSVKQHFNKINEKSRIQTYAFDFVNGLYVTTSGHTVDITTPETYTLDIEGSFLVGSGIYYDYYAYDGEKFTVSGDDLIDYNDRIIVGNRIPYGVDKISEVFIDGRKIEYVDERSFNMYTQDYYTIIKDRQGNSYLYLPFTTQVKIAVIKFVPDLAKFNSDLSVIDIPYEYIDVIAYDVARTELLFVEDDRAVDVFKIYKDILKDYGAYKTNTIKRTKNRIGFAPTYQPQSNGYEIITEAFYAPYK